MPRLIIIYSFCCQIQTDGRLLYVMMDNSLETYTARCQVMALHNSQTFDNINKVNLFIPSLGQNFFIS